MYFWQLPSIFQAVEEKRGDTNQTAAITTAVKALFSHAPQALEQCEVLLEEEDKKAGNDDDDDAMMDVFMATQDDNATRSPLRASLLQSLSEKQVLNLEQFEEGRKIIAEDALNMPSRLGGVAASGAQQLESSLLQQLSSPDAVSDSLLDTFVQDHASQAAMSSALVKKMDEWASSLDFDSLSRASQVMLNKRSAVAVWLLYVSPTSVLAPFATLFDKSEFADSGEEPAVLGPIVLLAQILVHTCIAGGVHLDDMLPRQTYQALPGFVRASALALSLTRFPKNEQDIIANWTTSLFGSEGISDDLIRRSSPQLMLRITPTLFAQAVNATISALIDSETLRSGLTYYLQDLLSYSLPCALRWLVGEVNQCNATDAGHYTAVASPASKDPGHDEAAPQQHQQRSDDVIALATIARRRTVCLEVLARLLASESCPSAVHILVAADVVAMLEGCRSDPKLPEECGTLLPLMQQQMYGLAHRRPDVWTRAAQQAQAQAQAATASQVAAA